MSPASSQSSYDQAGNRIQDRLYNYEWDGSNQLRNVSTIAGVVIDAEKMEMTIVYDAEGRRVKKTVKRGLNETTGLLELESERRFVYDG